MKNYGKWSKSTFIEWLKNQDEICKNYCKNFEDGIDSDDEFVDVETYAKNSSLKSWFRIKHAEDRKHVLMCLEKLVRGEMMDEQKQAGVVLQLC